MIGEDIVRSAWRHAERGRNDRVPPMADNKPERNSLSGEPSVPRKSGRTTLARTLQRCDDSKLTHNGESHTRETIADGKYRGNPDMKYMEPVTTDPKGESRKTAANTSALAKDTSSKKLDGSYVTGFTDGEGSFLVSFNRRSGLATGIEVRPSFTISQHERNKEILLRLASFFRCGGLRFDKHDRTIKFEVRSLSDLHGKIIPHFKRHPLQTSKKQDFERFEIVCSLMRQNQHRSIDGLRRIIDLSYEMNNLGARRYDKSSLLQMMSKVKV